jgi:hypothetical protein
MNKALTAEDFSLASCQATIFTPEDEIASARLVKDLLPQWVDRFDADPVVLPAVDGLPREVPRLVLQSKTSDWRCEIAAARVNVFWRRLGDATGDPTLPEVFAQAVGLLEQYLQLTVPRVGRLAGVLNWVAKHDSPALFLARHFCKDRWEAAPLNRPEDFELHALKHYSLMKRYNVNSWVRNKSAQLSSSGSQYSVVLVEQDLNTLAEEASSRSFTIEEIKGYFDTLSTEFLSILRSYYPTDPE